MSDPNSSKMARPGHWLAMCSLVTVTLATILIAKLAHCEEPDCSNHLGYRSKSGQLIALISVTKRNTSKDTPSLEIIRSIVSGAIRDNLVADDDRYDEIGKLKQLVEMLEAREKCYEGSRTAKGVHSLVEFVKEHAKSVKPRLSNGTPRSSPDSIREDDDQVRLLLEQLNQKNQELSAKDKHIQRVQSEKADMQSKLNQKDQELSDKDELIEELRNEVAQLEEQLKDHGDRVGGSSIKLEEKSIPSPHEEA